MTEDFEQTIKKILAGNYKPKEIPYEVCQRLLKQNADRRFANDMFDYRVSIGKGIEAIKMDRLNRIMEDR